LSRIEKDDRTVSFHHDEPETKLSKQRLHMMTVFELEGNSIISRISVEDGSKLRVKGFMLPWLTGIAS